MSNRGPGQVDILSLQHVTRSRTLIPYRCSSQVFTFWTSIVCKAGTHKWFWTDQCFYRAGGLQHTCFSTHCWWRSSRGKEICCISLKILDVTELLVLILPVKPLRAGCSVDDVLSILLHQNWPPGGFFGNKIRIRILCTYMVTACRVSFRFCVYIGDFTLVVKCWPSSFKQKHRITWSWK